MVVGAQQQTVEVSADVLFFHSDSNALGSTFCFFFSSRRRHTRWNCEWSSDVCSSDLIGWLFPGAAIATFFVFTDMLDGQLARLKGSSGRWGAFLDSTMDRVGDAAVFGGIIIWF